MHSAANLGNGHCRRKAKLDRQFEILNCRIHVVTDFDWRKLPSSDSYDAAFSF
jgi:hypothetical protein